jgi:hypothetical protein
MTQPEFERQIVFVPAYDRRNEKPNYGQHPMHMLFVLFRQDKGALVFDVNTGWYIDRTQKPVQIAPHYFEMSAHRYHDHNVHADEGDYKDNCEWLGGATCLSENLYGLTAPIHEDLWNTFLTEGQEALWKRLEQVYTERM